MASSSSSSTPPHFFKVILSHTITQQMLEVPKKFVKKYGEALQAKEIYLKVANGAKWKVGLKKSNEKVWFEKGWEDFVKLYSIEIGYFLTFRYEGNSCFYVVIFDHTATEIEYQNKRFPVPVKNDIKEEFEENRLTVKTLGNNNVAQTMYSPMNKRRMKRSDEGGANNVICRSHELQKKEDLPTSQLNLERNKGIISRKNQSTTTEEARIITEKALKFKALTTNPSFMIIMKPSYLHTGNHYPFISREFANTHLKETKDLILYVSDEKVWKILCIERWSRGTQRFEMTTSGWKDFARDNSLKEGDICVFELMKKNIIQISFKATIFRLA